MESIRLLMCALLLSPAVALAQAEEPEEVEVVEEAPAEEAAPADEAPVEEVTEEGMSSDDAAAAEQGVEEAEAEPAGPRGGHQVDVFYAPTAALEFDGGVAEVHGDGFGARGLYRIGARYAVSGEYGSLSFGDNDELETTQARLAVGFVGDNDDGSFFGIFAEYDTLELENTLTGTTADVDGYSIHGRLAANRTEWLGFYGDLGYLRLEDDFQDYSGHELTLGAVVRVAEFGIFAEGRRTKIEGKDDGGVLALGEVRVGVRYEFGAIKPE